MAWYAFAIPGVISVMIAAFGVWSNRRKVSAEATQILTDIALSLLDPLTTEVDDLKKAVDQLQCKIEKLEAENELLHRWSQLLFSQVVELGYDPISFEQVQKWSNRT